LLLLDISKEENKMPSVPTYSRQVQQAAVPGVRVNTNAPEEIFGGGAASGAGFTKTASQTLSLIDKEREKAEQLRVLDAETKLAQTKNNLVYNPETGAMTKRGQDAFGVVDQYGKDFDTQAAEIEKSLSSPAQKAAFKQRADQHKADLNNQLQRHVFQESQAYDLEVTKSRVDVAQNEAVLNFSDPVSVARNLRVQEQTIMEHADRMGKDPETTKLMVTEAKSNTHTAIVERMLTSGQDKNAEEYLKNNRDQFTAKDLARVEKTVETSSNLGFAQRTTDDYMKKGLTMTQSFEQAKSIENPKQREAVNAQIREQFAMKKVAQEEADSAIYSRAASTIENNGGDTNAVSPRLRQALIESGKWDSITERALQIRTGKFVVTDKTKLYDLQQMAATPQLRDNFLKTNLDEYSTKISGPELDDLKKMQASMRKGDTKAADTFRSKQQIVNETARLAGVDVEDKDVMAEFNRAIDERAQQVQSEGGKVDYQQITDDLVVKGTVPGTGFFGFFKEEKRVYQTKEGDVVAIDFESIPRTDKLAIVETLKKRGMGNPSEEAILDLYKAKLGRIVNRGK
jgi:hypothetical protein